jgi:hypothetical protein
MRSWPGWMPARLRSAPPSKGPSSTRPWKAAACWNGCCQAPNFSSTRFYGQSCREARRFAWCATEIPPPHMARAS